MTIAYPPTFGPGAACSGQITVTTAGTAVQGSDVQNDAGFFVRALAGNAGVAYVGNNGSGDVSSSNGYELSAGDQILLSVDNLKDLWFDAANNGDKLCWLKA